MIKYKRSIIVKNIERQVKMNQILVSQKLYVTPAMRKKKKLFKIEFFLSVLLVCLLSSYYIYAEYDRNKSEAVSQEILADININTDTTVKQAEDDVIVVVLNEEEAQEKEEEEIDQTEEISTATYVADDGTEYTTEAVLNIPEYDIHYPVLSTTSPELLWISLNKYWGPNPNEIGNYCIVGHNYRNGKMFGRLNELENGDIVTLEDMTGRTLQYAVYDRFIVNPDDTSCTSQAKQLENGIRELTLITCTNHGTQRLVVKLREI